MATPDLTSQKVEVSNFLGHDYAKFKNEMYKIGISTPSVYFDMRQRVYDKVKTKIITNMYENFWSIMLAGKDSDDDPVISLTDKGEPIAPCVPKQIVNNFAVSASETMEEILMEMLEYLLPVDINSIMTKKLVQAGLAEKPITA